MLLQEFARTGLFNTLREMERLQTQWENTNQPRTIVPRANIYESPTDFVVMADLPGVDEKGIDITVEKNILTIRASVEQDSPADHTLICGEYPVGDFLRKFALPNDINREGISATVKNGVLKLVLPKAAEATVRKIEVKQES